MRKLLGKYNFEKIEKNKKKIEKNREKIEKNGEKIDETRKTTIYCPSRTSKILSAPNERISIYSINGGFLTILKNLNLLFFVQKNKRKEETR